ncbi:hypothetical protein CR513_34903, partial [Mucuna pruriens]
MVKKANGKWHTCTDYTYLNKVCPKDPYSLPNIVWLVDGASSFTLLSFMDAYSGYNNIKMHPQDEAETAFIMDLRTYYYKVMPFGLRNTGATYPRLMDKIFEEIVGMNVGIEANPEKWQAIINMRSPQTVKESAERIVPIFNTLKKGDTFAWSTESEEAFLKLKALLASPSILTKPIPDIHMLIYILVAKNTKSAAIVQEREGKQHPIYFISKVLQDAEKRYQKIEKTTLTLIIASRRLRPYFQGYPMVVQTDLPIKQVLRKPDLARRMVT